MKPTREHATNNAQTYFVTSDTWERRELFRAEPWARLFFKTLLSHRGEAYLLHEFVLMPDHFHLLVSPSGSLERAIQLIKGGFSYRAKKELGSNAEIWRRGFADHRIRHVEDYDTRPLYPPKPDEEASMQGSGRIQVLLRISGLEVRPHPSLAKARSN
ncbi:MAG: transposase [Terracidiphilus sp.]